MERFTTVVYDVDEEEYMIFVVSARSADDVENVVKEQLFERALHDADITWGDVDYDIEQARETVTLDTIAVFKGDHPNLIVPDPEVEYIVVREGWTLTVPNKPA